MQRSRTTAAAAALALVLTATASADGPDRLLSARQLLARQDAVGAVAALEAMLPTATPAQRVEVIDLLRRAYPDAIRQADAAGKADEAESYRENLAILERKPRAGTPAPAPRPAADPTPAPPAMSARPAGRPLSDPAVVPAVSPPAEPLRLPNSREVKPEPAPVEPPPRAQSPPDLTPPAVEAPAPVEAVPAPRPGPEPAPALTPTPTPAAAPTLADRLAAADAAFVARKYDEAGKLYAALDAAKQLPLDRRDHWAYCRAADVVRRLNAHPNGVEEWAAIDAEIERIRALSPKNWFAEYLRSKAAERNPGAKAAKSARSNKVVLRGSSPEEPPPAVAAPPPVAPLPAPAPVPAPAAGPAPGVPPAASAGDGSAPTAWSAQPVFTTNFQVVHTDAHRALAEQVARAAEAAREAGMKRWGDPGRGAPWTPRCEIVLFPNAAEFSRQTGQPADSPGFSTMGMNEGRIVFRRVHLRADHANTVPAILPHEVTHVILADLFPHQQIPRWADEGMAVLAEPAREQAQRAAELDEPLGAGRVFRLSDLMKMDYPEPDHWSLYYAQSVSLTRFLVDQGTPAQFVSFVQKSQTQGVEPALKQVYKIGGFSDLQDRWASYARAHTGTATATARAGEADTTRR